MKRTIFNENISEEGATTAITSLIPMESEEQTMLELPSLS